MKNLVKLTALFCMILFFASCEKDHDPIEPSSSEVISNFKDENDHVIIYSGVPTIQGHITLTYQEIESGVTIVLSSSNLNYNKTETVDENGDYIFNNLAIGTYNRKIYIGGVLSSINTIRVQY